MRRLAWLAMLLASFVLLGADDDKEKPEDAPKADGLASPEIMQVIRANLNQIRHCYEALLQTSPQASGKVTANFVIGGTTGEVTSVSLPHSTIENATFRGCIVGKIKAWKFPKPRGGKDVTVNYPFVFNPL